jgi:two-component system, chemotaxis family, CheB/CheR fusion protein
MPAKKAARKKALPSRRKKSAGSTKKNIGCPIVGIGGSAGGFEAAMELFHHLPSKTGMAFVIVQHLDPHHASRLPSLLAKVTQIPVIEVTGTIKAESDNVYVQPPNKQLIVKDGELRLTQRGDRSGVGIDHFFESLAEAQGPRAIGVVLSGMGSDGTAGLRAIKAAGGLTFTQDEESAKYSGMPHSAIQSGFADVALSPGEIAAEIERIASHPYLRRAADEREDVVAKEVADLDDLHRIFLALKKHTGVDFTEYKQSTLNRRIQRRMALHRINRLSQYANFLRGNNTEIEALFDDLLINVTHFFRDHSAFDALKRKFLPALLKVKKRKRELRVWVPGCATGEEVYSIAICILEALGKHAATTTVQVFGTDLSESAINRARIGIYSSAIEKEVSRHRLKRFFKKLNGTYQINRAVRDRCTFARQNILIDPPFSHLDLISCRNVLIYLGTQLQKRCLPLFHYALNPGGYLMLGPAENIGIFSELFELVDKRNKIYAKKVKGGGPELDLPAYRGGSLKTMAAPRLPPLLEGEDFNAQVQRIADRILLGNYAPCGVVVDSNMQIRQFRGQTAPYLEHRAGHATLNLFQMARPGILADLHAVVQRAFKTEQPVRKENVLVKHDSKILDVNIDAVPFKLPASEQRWLLLVFTHVTSHEKIPKGARKPRAGTKQGEAVKLRRELAATRESLQTIIEEQEATNEELKSANEEIESSNEELQSTNEELETAKEELQSTNEELTTLNEELSNRNLEMLQVNNDLNNLLSSIQIPIVMVDNNLKIRRATPTARQVFNITDTDVGRRMTELKPNIDVPALDNLLREVIGTLNGREREVRDIEGRLYSLRIRPYRTADNKIDGAVLTLVDIDSGKKKSRSTNINDDGTTKSE